MNAVHFLSGSNKNSQKHHRRVNHGKKHKMKNEAKFTKELKIAQNFLWQQQ